MPNWVSNLLEISGSPDEIKKFKKQVKSKHSSLSLDKIVPCPNELAKANAPNDNPRFLLRYGHSNWYAFNVANWGTKWDVDAELTASESNYLEYSFDSAWWVPDRALLAASKKYPHLTFVIRYCGEVDCPGVITIHNGRMRQEIQKEGI